MSENVSIKTILYATDLSESARFAAAYAFSQADAYNAKVILLHVLPEMPEIMDRGVMGYIDEDQWESIKESHYQDAKQALIGKRNDHAVVHQVLDQFSRRAAAGQTETSSDDILVEKGNPVEVILQVAEERDCDLIVMGTHGRGTLADAMLGSTARRVVRRSTTPVLVVRLPAEDE
jgi:nucleotide-binding universal stress UspA family protein